MYIQSTFTEQDNILYKRLYHKINLRFIRNQSTFKYGGIPEAIFDYYFSNTRLDVMCG